MPWPRVALASLTGAALTFLTLWFHAFWVFGLEMDYINGGMQPMAPSLPVTTLFFAELALFPALLFGFGLAITGSTITTILISVNNFNLFIFLGLYFLSFILLNCPVSFLFPISVVTFII